MQPFAHQDPRLPVLLFALGMMLACFAGGAEQEDC